jgi:hypothetical protein
LNVADAATSAVRAGVDGNGLAAKGLGVFGLGVFGLGVFCSWRLSGKRAA